MESQKAIVRNALDTGKPDQALQTLRGLLREYPEDANLQNLMGLTQLALKNPARAVRFFSQAYKLDKATATGLNLSSALIEAGDPEKAVTLLKALGRQAERDKYAYKERILHNMGYAFAKLNHNAKAEQWLKEALEENPTFFPSHLELARLYEKTKRPALAMKSYRQAVDYCTICYEPVQSLATLYMKSGKYADARRLLMNFQKVEGTTPEDRDRAAALLRLATTTGIPGAPRTARK